MLFRESVIFESVFGSLSSRENERREIAHCASFLRFGAGTRNVRESSRRYPKEEEEEDEDDPKLVPVLQTQNEREEKISKKTINIYAHDGPDDRRDPEHGHVEPPASNFLRDGAERVPA